MEVVILARVPRSLVFKTYPVFYFYIACVFAVSAGLYAMHAMAPANVVLYGHWYWRTQLGTLVIGYGVILEMSRQALAAYPGAERFVRSIALGIFLVVFLAVGAHLVVTGSWSLNALTNQLEKDLRVVEALFLASILGVLSYYRIRIGKNLMGLIAGMGIYVGASLVTLSLFELIGPRFNAAWWIVPSGSYLLALAVWANALWSYSPNRSPSAGSLTQADYEALAVHTRNSLEALRCNLNGVVRS